MERSAEQLRKDARSAVGEITADAEARLVMTALINKVFAERPQEFCPEKYRGPEREGLIRLMIDKNETVPGSAGRVCRSGISGVRIRPVSGPFF